MKNKAIKYYLSMSILLIAFIVFTLIVRFVNPAPIGPNNSIVGLSTLNKWIFEKIGVHSIGQTIADLMIVIAIASAGIFAVLGVIQLIKRKSIKNVDKVIISLGIIYLVIILFYVFFEFVIVNYRPILIDGILETSYPSTHTMIACSIIPTSMFASYYYIKNKAVKNTITICSALFVLITLVARIISGVHWFTDIIGAILLSSTIVLLFLSLIRTFENNKSDNQ